MVLFYRISGSLATLSFIGALFVIVTFLTIKELRRHPTRMVFLLSICDMMFSLKFLVTSVLPNSESFQEGWPCLIQAGVQQFFGLASISWSGMISLNLIITAHRPFDNTAYYNKFYHIWVWGLSLITSAIMYAFGKIGPSGDGTCWVEIQNDPIRLLFFVPLLLYFSLSIGSLITAAVYSGATSTLSDSDRRGMLLRMSSYTLVFILCWVGPLAHRIAQWSGEKDDENHPNALMYWDAISVSIQGFMNAMVWLTNPSFFKGFFLNLKKYIPCANFGNEENIPLLRSISDESQDPTQLAVSLRNYVLMCCLKGINLSVKDNSNIDSILKQQLKSGEEIEYTEKDLFRDELNLQNSTIKRHRVKDYDPQIYTAIRHLKGITPEDYLKSFNATSFFDNLSNQKFSEGKSGSFMCFTPDNKYLIKTVTRQESILLRKKMFKFYQYLTNNRSTYLLVFYGSYKVTMPNDHTVYLSIMSNVFSSAKQKIAHRFDLKGSTINRGGSPNYDLKSLGLDLDFINTYQHLKIPRHLQANVLDQLNKDAHFLCSLNIMDYSLLIGIHPNANHHNGNDIGISIDTNMLDEASSSNGKHEGTSGDEEQEEEIHEVDISRIVSADQKDIYYIGIIDILQLYDLNKKMERFVKVYLVQKDQKGISAVPPEFYVERFMKRMNQIIYPPQSI